MKQALIVIDMQNGVFSLKRPVYRKDALAASVKKAVRFARNNGMPVMFSLHENDTFLRRGTEGHRLIDALEARAGDLAVHKSQPDIFVDTDLDAVLRRRGIAALIVTGVISNGCVRRACQSALEKGYSVTLVKDAHSTFYANAATIVERINLEMKRAGVRLVSVDALCADA